MCGIAGYIGRSKKPKVSYELITNIFAQLENRGTDASGMWGLENKEKPKVIYHKCPMKTSDFVKTSTWEKVQKLNPNLLLVHARRTSPGIGHAKHNENNHPFVSADKRIGVIHNGKIHEASFLSDKYETETDCDSEILLRMYEHAIQDQPMNIPKAPQYMKERLASVHELWSVVRQGSCAAMVGELHIDGSRTLMLFRNEKRPLWVADLRESLGQIFFFSETNIWKDALDEFSNASIRDLGVQKLAEIPTNEVWGFKLDSENQIVSDSNFHRIKIHLDKKVSKDWVAGKDKKKVIPNKLMNLSVVTDLDDKGEPPKDQQYTAQSYSSTVCVPKQNSYTVSGPWAEQWCDRWGHYNYANEPDAPFVDTLEVEDVDSPDFDEDSKWLQDHTRGDWDEYFEEEGQFKEAAEAVSSHIEDIKELLDQIETNFVNSGLEGSMTADNFSELLNSLEDIHRDLEGTAHFLKL